MFCAHGALSETPKRMSAVVKGLFFVRITDFATDYTFLPSLLSQTDFGGKWKSVNPFVVSVSVMSVIVIKIFIHGKILSEETVILI